MSTDVDRARRRLVRLEPREKRRMMGTGRRVNACRHADQDRARNDAHRGLGRRVGTGRKRGGGGKERQERRGGGGHREEMRRAFSARETRRASDR